MEAVIQEPVATPNDIAVRIDRKEFPYQDPYTLQQTVKVVEMIEYDIPYTNFRGERTTTTSRCDPHSGVGVILKECRQVVDALRERIVSLTRERDELQALVDQQTSPEPVAKQEKKR